jgi:D-lactate dehydrogenase (quinone)
MQHSNLLLKLQSVAGRQCVISDEKKTQSYRTGWRSGSGSALAVVIPQDLLVYYRVLQVCVKHQAIIIMQAANTGLTEGSTPNGDDMIAQLSS